MNITDLKQQIEANSIQDLYIFTGEEDYLKRLYISKISSKLSLPCNFVQEESEIKPPGLFYPKQLYIIFNSKLKELNLRGNYGIVVCENLDKRTSFYKTNRQNVIEFKQAPVEQIISLIKKRVNLSNENCLDLASRCNNNLGIIDLELHKFTSYNPEFNDSDYFNLKNTFYDIVLDEITFDLSNAILEKKDILKYYSKCLQINQSVLGMLSAVYINITRLLQIKTSSTNVETSTGLTPFIIKKLLPYKNNYTVEELLKILNIIFEIDTGIKTGTIKQEFAFKYLLCKL